MWEEHFLKAVGSSNVEILERMISDANEKNLWPKNRKQFMTNCLLKVCSQVNVDPEVLDTLLKTEQDLQQKDESSIGLNLNAALQYAARVGNVAAVTSLLKHGAEVTYANGFGQISLHLACRSGSLNTVQALLDYASPLDCKDCGECTPLRYAINSPDSNVEIASLLIKSGCDIDTVNDELLSPLDEALLYNMRPIISLLLTAGCHLLEGTQGYIYYAGHYCNSVIYSLIADQDVENIKLLMECGYRLNHNGLKLMLHRRDYCCEALEKLLVHIVTVPRSLLSLCRISVRQNLNLTRHSRDRLQCLESCVDELSELPQKIKDYLAFRV